MKLSEQVAPEVIFESRESMARISSALEEILAHHAVQRFNHCSGDAVG
jgi:hypothetical protein